MRLPDRPSDPQRRTLYELLGVGPGSGDAEIRAAYLALIKLHHPDVMGGLSTDRAAQINYAFSRIGSRRGRQLYDEELQLDRGHAPGPAMPRPQVAAKMARARRGSVTGAFLLAVSAATIVLIIFGTGGVIDTRGLSAGGAAADARRPAAHADAVDPGNIAEAVVQFESVAQTRGSAAVEALSRGCFADLRGDPALPLLDRCVAIDVVASLWSPSAGIDGQSDYFGVARRSDRAVQAIGGSGLSDHAQANRIQQIERHTLVAMARHLDKEMRGSRSDRARGGDAGQRAEPMAGG